MVCCFIVRNLIYKTISLVSHLIIIRFIVGQPYARSTIGLPYASPQDGGQYLAAINSTVSYLTTTTVIAKEQDNENDPPYCVAYPNLPSL